LIKGQRKQIRNQKKKDQTNWNKYYYYWKKKIDLNDKIKNYKKRVKEKNKKSKVKEPNKKISYTQIRIEVKD
jgi:hypothetical protein